MTTPPVLALLAQIETDLRGLPKLGGWTALGLLALADKLWDLPEHEFQYVALGLQ